MNKKEYLEELSEKLSRMKEEERLEVLRYYEEYFDEAGIEQEEEVIKNLGTPSQLARQIMAEVAVKESVEKPQSSRKGLWAIGLIILALLATPVAFPLAITAIVLIFVAVLLVGIFLFVGVILVFSLGVTGISLIAAAFKMFFITPATGLLSLGIGIGLINIILGICLLIGILVYVAIMKGMPILIKWVSKGLNRGLDFVQKRGK